MPYIDFDQYEAEALAHLAEHYDANGQFLDISQFYKYDERGQDAAMKTIERFIRYDLVRMHSRASIEICSQVLDVVAQLCGDPHVAPEPPANITYNIHGSNARVNVHSHDASTNIAVQSDSVFAELHEIINTQISNTDDRDTLLALVAELHSSVGTSSFLDKYKAFVSVAANHMTVIAPVLPALTQLLA